MKLETLLQTIMNEPDFQDSTEYAIIAINGNRVWQSTQGNHLHLLQVIGEMHDKIKKDMLKDMVAKLTSILDDTESDDPVKMDLAKAEALKAMKNITKH